MRYWPVLGIARFGSPAALLEKRFEAVFTAMERCPVRDCVVKFSGARRSVMADTAAQIWPDVSPLYIRSKQDYTLKHRILSSLDQSGQPSRISHTQDLGADKAAMRHPLRP